MEGEPRLGARCDEIVNDIDAVLMDPTNDAGYQRGLDSLHNFEWLLIQRYEDGEISFDEVEGALDAYIDWFEHGRPDSDHVGAGNGRSTTT